MTSRYNLVLDICYYVPFIIKNNISIFCLNKLKYRFLFENNSCSILLNDEIIEKGTLINGLFILDEKSTIINMDVNVKRKIEKVNDSYLWHYRLGHIGKERIQKLHKGEYLDLFDY